MQSVGIRQLKDQTSEVLRRVCEKGKAVQVTNRGRVVAHLVPVSRQRSGGRKTAAVWADLDRLAAEIGAHWPAGKTAADTVREGRRKL